MKIEIINNKKGIYSVSICICSIVRINLYEFCPFSQFQRVKLFIMVSCFYFISLK